jgi:hypothetical protein
MDVFNLAQYIMVNWTHGSSVASMKNGNHSVIFLKFQFDRTRGFYILQIYIPLTIIVMSSWVSFWLIKTDLGHETAARTGLGATSTLAVVTIGFGGKTKPQVAYATALDIFIIICFISVFCALAEFALLSFLDLYIRKMKAKLALRQKLMDSCEEWGAVLPPPGALTNGGSARCRRCGGEEEVASWWGALARGAARLGRGLGIGQRVRRGRLYHHTTEVLHDIDSCCRKLFPSVFVILNLIYWTSYVYIL